MLRCAFFVPIQIANPELMKTKTFMRPD